MKTLCTLKCSTIFINFNWELWFMLFRNLKVIYTHTCIYVHLSVYLTTRDLPPFYPKFSVYRSNSEDCKSEKQEGNYVIF